MPRQRTCLVCSDPFESHFGNIICPDCRIFTGQCEFCEQSFTRKLITSRFRKHGLPRFCCLICRNKGYQLVPVPCPICGTLFKPYVAYVNGNRKKYCSVPCAHEAHRGFISPKRTPAHIIEAIKSRYPTEGADLLAKEYGMTHSAVCGMASKHGVRLTPAVYRERVHEKAREHMLNNNPMHRPECVAKVLRFWEEHPEQKKERDLRAVTTRAAIDRKNPSGLERRLWTILDDLSLEYETQTVIKPKFVVDVKIGNLIIECDGDYWHGNPVLYPKPSSRQHAQQLRDRARDKYLAACGYKVVRIWESDMSLATVMSVLTDASILTCTEHSLENALV